MRGEGASQGIDHNLHTKRGRHHRRAVTQRLGVAKIAIGRRVEVERGLAGTVDHAHRPVVDHTLSDSVVVEGEQRRVFTQVA